MKVWTCNDHAGHYPVGTASVVIAGDEETARSLLAAELDRRGLNPERFTLVPMPWPVENGVVRVLDDGNY